MFPLFPPRYPKGCLLLMHLSLCFNCSSETEGVVREESEHAWLGNDSHSFAYLCIPVMITHPPCKYGSGDDAPWNAANSPGPASPSFPLLIACIWTHRLLKISFSTYHEERACPRMCACVQASFNNQLKLLPNRYSSLEDNVKKKKECIWMYSCVTLLCSINWQNIVNQLYYFFLI